MAQNTIFFAKIEEKKFFHEWKIFRAIFRKFLTQNAYNIPSGFSMEITSTINWFILLIFDFRLGLHNPKVIRGSWCGSEMFLDS